MRNNRLLSTIRWSALVSLIFGALGWSQDAVPNAPPVAAGPSTDQPVKVFGDVRPTFQGESTVEDEHEGRPANPIATYLDDEAHGQTECIIPELHGRSEGGVFVYGEYLLLRPRRTALDFAIVDPTDDLTPQGSIESVDWDTRSGFRVGGSVLRINHWDFSVAYTYLHSTGSNLVAAPPGGTVFATASSSLAISEVDAALATANLDYDVLDFFASRSLHRWAHGETFVDVGGRVAWIDQKFQATYDGETSTGTFLSSPVNFDGVGLRLGGRSEWNLCSCLVGYARAGASLVAGTFDVGFSETDGGVVVADVGETYDDVIPVVDLAVGCRWEYRSLWLGVSYEVVQWFDLVNSPDLSSSFFTPGKLSRRTSDLNLSGLGVQLGWNY